MTDLKLLEALRYAEIEIGRLRTERAELMTTIAGLRGLVAGLKLRLDAGRIIDRYLEEGPPKLFAEPAQTQYEDLCRQQRAIGQWPGLTTDERALNGLRLVAPRTRR